MMYFFEFKMPRILCADGGAGRLGKTMARLGGTRALIVTDAAVHSSGLVEQVASGLDSEATEVVGVFNEVPSDPGISTIERCADVFAATGADSLISVGGGSCIDTAKATIIQLCEPGDLRSYEWKEYFASVPVPPHIAIPTTAGTGSEATHVAMITDEEKHRKLMYNGGDLIPRLAVLDPRMTVTLPPPLTAVTGMDALAHGIEAVHSIWHQPLADGLALQAVQLTGKFLDSAYTDGSDLFVRMNMQLAATMGGVAASNAFIGIVHATAHPLGAMFKIPHGAAVGVMLPYAMEMNLEFEEVPARYRMVAEALGIDVSGLDDVAAARKAIGWIRLLIARLNLPRRLEDLNIPADAIEALTDEAVEDRAMMVTPGSPGRDQVKALYEKAF